MSTDLFRDTHPELARIGIKIRDIDERYRPLMRTGISIDEMIYVARRLYPLLKGSKKILDLGCGNGLITVLLYKMLGSELNAIDDWSKVSKEELMRNIQLDDAKIKLSDFKESLGLPYSDSSFDAVYSVMFLWNLGKEIRRKVASEVKRVLEDNGKFIIVDTFVIRTKLRRELEDLFDLAWYGEENAFSFFLWSKNK